MIPTHINNIFGIKINSASTNGSINFGNTLMKGNQANVKGNVGYLQPGDAVFSPLQFNNANFTNDPDGIDQPQSQI